MSDTRAVFTLLQHPRSRLVVWIFVAAGLSVGQFGWIVLAAVRARAPVGWSVISVFFVLHLLLIFLLITTPPGAIRLRARTSTMIVIGVTVLLQATHNVLRPDVRLWHYLLACAVVGITLLINKHCIPSGHSVWWAAVVGWCPLFLLV